MVKFETCMSTAALAALLVACGSGSHQPEPPAATPAPAIAPQATPPSAPNQKAKPKKAEPRDSVGSGNYPWPSALVTES
jgi:hypothetical protein